MSFFTEVLTHTAFFMIFLPIFFFFYVSLVQSKSLLNDLFNALKPSIVTSSLVTQESQEPQLLDAINSAAETVKRSDYFVEQSQRITDTNKKIVLYSLLGFELGGVALLAIGLGLHYAYGESLSKLLISNFIVMAFIIASEFLIIGVFLTNFVEINDNFIKGVAAGGQCIDYVDQFMYSTLPESIANIFVSKPRSP